MRKIPKTTILLLACILIVGTLTSIQYFLVNNSYQLTKDKYYAEVKKDILAAMSEKQLMRTDENTVKALQKVSASYYNKKLDRKEFFDLLKKHTDSLDKAFTKNMRSVKDSLGKLDGINYHSRFTELILSYRDKIDTLLRPGSDPIVFLGEAKISTDTILISRNATTTYSEAGATKDNLNHINDIRISFKQLNYATVPFWKEVVMRRMALTLILAIGLIVAVSFLFYLVFRAMLAQKKVAEVKTDFANNITHELQTPLSSASVIFKTLQRQDVRANTELTNGLLDSLQRQHEKIQHVVNSVIESAMAEQLTLPSEPILIDEFLIAYADGIKIDSHEFNAKIDWLGSHVNTNAQAIEKILNGLIENAIKYSEPGTSIELRGFAKKDDYCIEVSDQGKGIPPAYQKQIFEKFYRIPESNIHSVKGLGLGLYLCQQAAAQIGASLTVESKAGQGSTFKLSLPV